MNGFPRELRDLPLESIVPNRDQPRKLFEAASLAELAASVASLGVLEPVVVRVNPPVDGEAPAAPWLLVAGERRWRAAKEAGLRTIPAIVRYDLDEQAAFELSIVENVLRADMSPVEEAHGYQRLVDAGMTVETLSLRLGKSAHSIRTALSLLKLEPALLDLVAKGHLTAWDGSRLATLSWEGQRMAFKVIDANHLTGNDRDRVIGQVWYSERAQGIFAEDAVPATDPARREKGASLRKNVERAATLLGYAESNLAEAALDESTIDLIEGISKMTARLVREARQARAAALVVHQMSMEGAA